MPRDLYLADAPDLLNQRFQGDPLGAIRYVVDGGLGQGALVSSFGADSSVLLHMVAQIDRMFPVLFIDTLFLFPETLRYQSDLAQHLGLGDVRRIRPDRVAQFQHDPDSILHRADPDACCALRKARPLAQALAPFDAWMTGRKRYQGGQRATLPMFEHDPQTGRIKVNPLVDYSAADLRAYIAQYALPLHPLVAKGFASIGCAPCTTPVAPDEAPRAGRWRGHGKTECGIHVIDGKIVRGMQP